MKIVDDCPACGSTATTEIAVLDGMRLERYRQFSQRKFAGLLEKWLKEFEPVVRSCRVCGHCWYRYQPSAVQLSEMYSAGRPLTRASDPVREPSPAMILEMKRLRKLLQVDSGAPELLDYGSGFGRWARAAVIAGFRVTAYEPSADRGAELVVPFELIHDSAALIGRKFDVVQLEQVLEHVASPKDTLSEIKALCCSNTLLRITVPNILRAPEGKDVWARWPFDGESPHIMAPYEHLHGFTPKSLDAVIRSAGLESVRGPKHMRLYPLNCLRILLSKTIPSIGSTLRIAKLLVASPNHQVSKHGIQT